MHKKIFILIILFIIVFTLSIFSKKMTLRNNLGSNYVTRCGIYDKKEIFLDTKTIKIDISDNDCKRELGLSDREGLESYEGMIFIFGKAGNHAFWMKDMKFPIDILWINDDFSIVGIEKSVATSTFPEIFGQNYPARYVLELSSGYSFRNNIKVGDKIIYL